MIKNYFKIVGKTERRGLTVTHFESDYYKMKISTGKGTDDIMDIQVESVRDTLPKLEFSINLSGELILDILVGDISGYYTEESYNREIETMRTVQEVIQNIKQIIMLVDVNKRLTVV